MARYLAHRVVTEDYCGKTINCRVRLR